jgi:hypothetical protein
MIRSQTKATEFLPVTVAARSSLLGWSLGTWATIWRNVQAQDDRSHSLVFASCCVCEIR